MSQNFYSTGIQLAVRLVAAGIISNPQVTPEDFVDYDAAMIAAWQAWEDMTGYTPFLAQSVDSTHYFDPDGSRTVDLQGGFVSITSVSVNGNAQTLNTGYRTMPMNAVTNGKPITYLKFDRTYGVFTSYYAPLIGQSGSIAVTGKRGAYAVLPQLAVEGIFAIAICSLLGTFEFSKFRGMKSWVIGTDERVYDQQAYARLCAACQQNIAAALRRYRRVKVA